MDGRIKLLQSVSGVPGTAYNPFLTRMLSTSTPYPYFDFEQAVMLDFWLQRVQQKKVLTFKQLQLGITLGISGRTSYPRKNASSGCGYCDASLEITLKTKLELMKSSFCRNPN